MSEFFHLTPVDNVPSILAEGLRPGWMGGVNVCTNWKATHGVLAMTRLDPETGEAPTFALFKVDCDGLDVEEFYDGALSPMMGSHFVEGAIPGERIELMGLVVWSSDVRT